jgi:hypothetical protein
MRRWLPFLLFFVMPAVALANPRMPPVNTMVAFVVVVLAALVLEAGVVALLLAFRGVSPTRMFVAFVLANFAVYFLLFIPLSERLGTLVLELIVVAADAVVIKLMSSVSILQGDSYRNVGWIFAGCAALVGNAVSFYFGMVSSNAFWERLQRTGGMED